MIDEPKIENNENNLNNKDKNVEKSGNRFSNNLPAYILLAMVAVCLIGTVIFLSLGMMFLDGIPSDQNAAIPFPLETIIHGTTFYLPEGYSLVSNTSSSSQYPSYTYSNGSAENITITFFPSTSNAEVLSIMESSSHFTKIKSYEDIGGFIGISAETLDGTKVFVFKKNGETFSIEVTKGLSFYLYVAKIIIIK